MKVLRPAVKAKQERTTLDFTCKQCKARLQAESGDGRAVSDRDGNAVVFTCPGCKGETWLDASLVPWSP